MDVAGIGTEAAGVEEEVGAVVAALVVAVGDRAEEEPADHGNDSQAAAAGC